DAGGLFGLELDRCDVAQLDRLRWPGLGGWLRSRRLLAGVRALTGVRLTRWALPARARLPTRSLLTRTRLPARLSSRALLPGARLPAGRLLTSAGRRLAGGACARPGPLPGRLEVEPLDVGDAVQLPADLHGH